ncbi:unnamed protein product [Acanthosepion pharaonis]|uniref:Uncharacterized protein n=1 Tax=Acanthosepion pharaonis TaxID=158019 RepID=A0A812EKA6_ACAPH|nr:unnamed protein product [Sepia pharaonis]
MDTSSLALIDQLLVNCEFDHHEVVVNFPLFLLFLQRVSSLTLTLSISHSILSIDKHLFPLSLSLSLLSPLSPYLSPSCLHKYIYSSLSIDSIFPSLIHPFLITFSLSLLFTSSFLLFFLLIFSLPLLLLFSLTLKSLYISHPSSINYIYTLAQLLPSLIISLLIIYLFFCPLLSFLFFYLAYSISLSLSLSLSLFLSSPRFLRLIFFLVSPYFFLSNSHSILSYRQTRISLFLFLFGSFFLSRPFRYSSRSLSYSLFLSSFIIDFKYSLVLFPLLLFLSFFSLSLFLFNIYQHFFSFSNLFFTPILFPHSFSISPNLSSLSLISFFLSFFLCKQKE